MPLNAYTTSFTEGAVSFKRKIKASEIVRDIRAGMTNDDLMQKHGLPLEKLLGIFTKLIDAKVMSHEELAFHMPSSQSAVIDARVRQVSRCYPPVVLRIYDLDDLTRDLSVKDLSEKGVHVVGIKTAIGRKASFLIQAFEFPDIDSLTFDAQCRWTKAETNEGGELIYDAGFEITEIDKSAQEQLLKIIAKFPSHEV
jgi:hypothetical protein